MKLRNLTVCTFAVLLCLHIRIHADAQTRNVPFTRIALIIANSPDNIKVIDDNMQRAKITERLLTQTLLREFHFKDIGIQIVKNAPVKLYLRVQVRVDRPSNLYGVSINLRLVKMTRVEHIFGRNEVPVVLWESNSVFPSKAKTLRADVIDSVTWLGRYFDSNVRGGSDSTGFIYKQSEAPL